MFDEGKEVSKCKKMAPVRILLSDILQMLLCSKPCRRRLPWTAKKLPRVARKGRLMATQRTCCKCSVHPYGAPPLAHTRHASLDCQLQVAAQCISMLTIVDNEPWRRVEIRLAPELTQIYAAVGTFRRLKSNSRTDLRFHLHRLRTTSYTCSLCLMFPKRFLYYYLSCSEVALFLHRA